MEACEILLRRGLIDKRQLDQARGQANGHGDGARQIEAAIQLGFVSEEAALRALGDEVGIEYVDLTEAEIDLSLLKIFPHRLIHRQSLFPISKTDGQLVVATSNPFDLYPLDEVSAATGLAVMPVLAARAEIAKLIKRHLGVGSETVEGLVAQAQEEAALELVGDIETDGSELSEMAQEASVVRLVNEILLEAIELRASDVHIESQPSGLAIRYRVDGMLQSQPIPPEIHRFEAAIVSRLKIMSRLNIAEKRLPQDGRMKLKVKGREIDVRVSVIPMIHGEGLVMRILDKGSMVFDLQKIGMEPDTYKVYRELIDLPHGIVLVTGPTGSGKTTTLYSSLIEINTPDVKIITTEDPVEYQLEGINQIQVHHKIGLTFAASLRSILRHDPDVVLVGEIRDLETAENAIQASLTGHMVFSTLHTNDAASAYTRLTDMGVEPFLVASTVEAVMAQRLVRRLCKHCKQPYDAVRDDVPSDFPWEDLQSRPLFKGVGCRECRNTGYRGRMGIYELLVTTNEIRQLACDRASSWKIMQAASKEGMRSLRQDGWKKVLVGGTSVEEVTRAAKADHTMLINRG
ncbi:type II secretion system protein E [Pirellula staleyi DSM 6068]|uniref:Type II secretion system protein E n=1 Tax=Pirellula staleyi (strain ATCC 27377 / DSM 6068 / ICPB 4128) TaxID=530564 RepID=D2QZD9_PIRSD|nr:ATPase, T2SS/T4P/T4SS family [Pirellula staleyi]ADB18331.1 type II secretion system protein E [Pirellula staleyi DSM 6068]